jgi:hypothetical protein
MPAIFVDPVPEEEDEDDEEDAAAAVSMMYGTVYALDDSSGCSDALCEIKFCPFDRFGGTRTSE